VKRLRLERALYLMSHAPNRSLTDVALDCGFSSSSDFSRSFSRYYDAAPSVFDLETFRKSRREEFERVLSSRKRGHRALVVDDVEPAGEIGRLVFPPMRVAEVVLSGGIELEARAIDWLYQTRLPRSGFVHDDQPAFEAWIGRPFAHGSDHLTIACQLPVKPA
jgi:hypothetical protein